MVKEKFIMEWYKDKNYIDMALKTDDVLDRKDCDEISRYYEKNIKLAKKYNNYIYKTFSYFFAYNCKKVLCDLKKLRDNDSQEEQLSLIRTAMQCYEKYLESNESDEASDILYLKLKVSLGNTLDNLGRVIPALENYKSVYNPNSSECNINLGIALYRYSSKCVNANNIHFLRKKSLYFLDKVYSIPENKEIYKSYYPIYQWLYNQKEHFKEYHVEKYEIEDDEKDYREWVARKNLALNPLNDIYDDIQHSFDSTFINEITSKIDDEAENVLLIFNEIKQEFVSARYQLYEGINNNNFHYSDRNNYLMQDTEGIIYSLGVEQVKNAYRSIYALFDRIGYFLYEYLGLNNIQIYRVSFNNVVREMDKNNFQKYQGFNGLWWIKKELYARGNDNNAIDPKMNDIRQLRNYMEHRFIKVVNYNGLFKRNDNEIIISADKLQNDAMYLLKKSREAIILLIIFVNEKEREKNKEVKEKGEKIGIMPVRKYSDDLKMKW